MSTEEDVSEIVHSRLSRRASLDSQTDVEDESDSTTESETTEASNHIKRSSIRKLKSIGQLSVKTCAAFTRPVLPIASSSSSSCVESPRSPVYSSSSSDEESEEDGHEDTQPKIRPNESSLLARRPSEPFPWTWTCHLCNRRYRLGVTRRCLVDGHYYCSGGNVAKPKLIVSQRRMRSKPKHRRTSCSSVFDFQSWKRWGRWKRGILKERRRRQQRERERDLLVKFQSEDHDDEHGDGSATAHFYEPSGCELCDWPGQCGLVKVENGQN